MIERVTLPFDLLLIERLKLPFCIDVTLLLSLACGLKYEIIKTSRLRMLDDLL